jgi:predicted transcriptional regulator
MTRKSLGRPTDAELAILRILWDRGACTVRQVHDLLAPPQPIGYTTVLKTMQIMFDKGLLERDEAQRAHLYTARVTEEQTQQGLVRDLLDRAFSGSAARMAMQALSTRQASPEEIEEIKRLLEEMSEQAEPSNPAELNERTDHDEQDELGDQDELDEEVSR